MRVLIVCLAVFGFSFGLAMIATATGPTAILRGDVAANFHRFCNWGDNVQVTAIPTASTASTGLTNGTAYRLYCAQDSYFDQGASDSATSADPTVKGGAELYFLVRAASDKMNLRAVGTTGNCDLTECL